MASPQLFTGDTYPAIRGAATEGEGEDLALMDLPSADALEFVAVAGEDAFAGAAEAIDPPEDVGDEASPLGFNWRYILDADDTAIAGSYSAWLRITWDAASEPPRIEWVKCPDNVVISAAPK